MTTYQVEVRNPVGDEVLQSLADWKLISPKKSSHEKFVAILEKLRGKAEEMGVPTKEEITKEEEEELRTARFAGNQTGDR